MGYEISKQDGAQEAGRSSLHEVLADTSRLDWLDKTGRVARFSDGWNAWVQGQQAYSRSTIREAIDACMSANS